MTTKTVLNVGSGGKGAKLPPWFDGWDVTRLDIDPKVEPDLLMDARGLETMDGALFDAVYCSHNLEHYSPHDGGVVLRGMLHVLKDGGFADIHVPNIGGVIDCAGDNNWDLDEVMYKSQAGPICLRDMLYGYERQRDASPNPDFMLHRNAFSARTLYLLMSWAGFAHCFSVQMTFDLRCVGFNSAPSDEQLAAIGLVQE